MYVCIAMTRSCMIKATIPDFVPVNLTWVCIIITVSVYSYDTYLDRRFAISLKLA